MRKPYIWPDFIYYNTAKGKEYRRHVNILHAQSRKIIKERAIDFETNDIHKQQRASFIDLLLKAKRDNPTVTFEDIREDVDTITFAGYETTAITGSFVCHAIGTYPEVQKKLHQEIDSVLGETNRSITKEDLPKLTYLDCVIKETMRIFTIVPFYARRLTEDVQVGNK
jgi:cytochrome P450